MTFFFEFAESGIGDNFSNILLQFVRIPNEIKPKTSDGGGFHLYLSISVTLFQYAILSFAKRPQLLRTALR